ncbi:MAG TPA: nitroreductase [Candidatus Dependentiae bacterium]|nr:nitroreductase [Candidatus Dependentiae bacterium]
MMKRKAQYPIHDIFINRWSPRAMSGEELSDEELMSLFEAARWAPSSFNEQPWRFIYAKRNTRYWDRLFNLMIPFNQSWTKNAAILGVIISCNTLELSNKPARTYSFDTGAAWENLSLQGSINGLVVHGIEGFDYNRAKKELNIPDDYTTEAMFAVGKPGKLEDLPPDLQEREKLSDRKKVEEFIFEGVFKE